MAMPDFDILIKNAQVVDGTGAPPFRGAIAVEGGRIAAVGRVEGDLRGDAEAIIDAGGLAVTPGFIDVHNHGDLSILYYPGAEGFIRQGITTFVGGHCGTSPGPYGEYVDQAYFLWDIYWRIAPDMYYPERLQPREMVNELHGEMYGWEIDWHTLGEFMKRVEGRGLSPNYVPIVGHGDIRYLVMGRDYRRAATKDEVEAMVEQVHLAMGEGSRGISVGRDYAPGYYADKDELVACAEAAAEHGGVYTSHSLRTGLRVARRPGEWPPGKIDGVLEAIDVGRRAKVSVEIAHLGPLYDVWPPGSEAMTEASVKATLKAVDEARGEGIDVNFDVIPNHLAGGIYSSPYLAAALLPWLRVAGSRRGLAEALRMGGLREEIRETVMAGKWYGLNPNINPGWASTPTIVRCREERFRGKTLAQVAEELGVEPLEALMEVLVADPDSKAMAMGEDDSAKLMFYGHPEMMVGIDTFAVDDRWEVRSPPWFLPNENSFGGFPRFFRRAVRETGTLTLEEAVRKVTSLPARKFGLTDRGVLREGAHADIVAMDPERVTDRGNAVKPRVYPRGIEHVVVNGVQVVEEGRHTGAMPGRVLRRE